MLSFERFFITVSIFGENKEIMSEWKLNSATYIKEGSDALIHVEWSGTEVICGTDNTPVSEEDFRKIVEDFKTRMASQTVNVA